MPGGERAVFGNGPRRSCGRGAVGAGVVGKTTRRGEGFVGTNSELVQ